MLYVRGPAGTQGVRARACRSIPHAVARICATPAQASPGARVEYSDLGFIVLGHLIERLSGESLARYARRHVFAPLGMGRTRFLPPRSWWPRCAATEAGNPFERGKAEAQGVGRRFPWRTALIRGQVHDGNAWYVGQGLAGHAGLFSVAADLVRFGRALLRGGALGRARVLPPGVVAEATRRQTSHAAGDPRGLGWALKGCAFVGTKASTGAFGHTGFTGTSVVVDPAGDALIVLLTNRVHPRADNTAILDFRARFHDAVFDALGS
jgi:CubicO group peptidase (beta-lactamase class C family)